MLRKLFAIFLIISSYSFSNMENYSITKKLKSDFKNYEKSKNTKRNFSEKVSLKTPAIDSIYRDLNLQDTLDYRVFSNALLGMEKIEDTKKDVITIIDFTKSSLKERFFVIDLKNKKVLFSTYVMHGKNSGGAVPQEFSNSINSYKSSPGFYVTDATYYGKFGYSLRLNGVEEGINDNARERAIVVHGSQYAMPSSGAKALSTSLGCPAIPKEISGPVINKIKDGRIIYIHTDQEEYLSKSSILKKI